MAIGICADCFGGWRGAASRDFHFSAVRVYRRHHFEFNAVRVAGDLAENFRIHSTSGPKPAENFA